MSASHWGGILAAGAALAAAPASARATGHVYPIVIQQMAFGSAPPNLKVGDTIEWVNKDIFLHSATAADHSFDATLKPGAKVRTPLTHAGPIAFACRYHPGMKGRLIVTR